MVWLCKLKIWTKNQIKLHVYKDTKKCVVKRKLKFKGYKQFLEATQFENKINHLEKNDRNMDNLLENDNKFMKNNKLILKIQQRFKSKKHVFIEEINKNLLSLNDDKGIQSIDSVEMYS